MQADSARQAAELRRPPCSSLAAFHSFRYALSDITRWRDRQRQRLPATDGLTAFFAIQEIETLSPSMHWV